MIQEEIISEKMNNVFNLFIKTRKSNSTRNKYFFVIKKFFQNIFNKNVSEITSDDLKKMKYSLVYKEFIEKERKRRVKDSTIKVSLNIVSSFLDFIDKEDVFEDINLNKIRINSLDTRALVNDEDHIKPMSKKDLMELEEWLQEKQYISSDGNLGKKYAALVDFLFVTAIRSSAVFKIRWNQFDIEKDSVYGGDFVKLTEIDKGSKKNIKYLPLEYYVNLKNLLYSGDMEECVFKDLTKINLISYMKKFSQITGKNISPHSIKVGAGTYVYSITKDIVKTSRFLDHSSIETTMRYIRDNGNPNESGSVIASRQYDYEKLNDLSKDELLLLVKGRDELKSIVYNEALQHGLIH